MMIFEFFENLDKYILLLINGLNTPLLDKIMKFISSSWFWIAPIVFFIILGIKFFKKKFWIPIVFALICFALTDFGSNITKNKIVKRYRPTHNLEICEKIHIVDNYRGGLYGFFSGHAANSFGLALISLLFIRKKYYTVIILFWAIIVSFSRIYLGVHYPFDVFCGMLYGCLIAIVLNYIYKYLKFKNKIVN